MSELEIKNIGPIVDIKIELNKINLFIGPQSSGKSTIVKIISFFFWLEKDIVVNQGIEHINEEYIRKNLVVFHNMDSYFRADSYLKYTSDFIEFEYQYAKPYSLKIVGDIDKMMMGKVSYIPSERNLLGIPAINTLPMEDNYIRSFIFDWLLIRNRFVEEKVVPILNLDIKYHYDSTKGDVLSISKEKDIHLSQASSGLQSIVPLVVYLNYVTRLIYDGNINISFDKYRALQEAMLRAIAENADKDVIDQALKEKDIREMLNRLIRELSSEPKYGKVNDLKERISVPHYSSVIIEEPEMNIFPETQYQLIKFIFSMMNFGRGDTICMTTHSPYVMTSINNMIQYGNYIASGQKLEGMNLPELNYKDVSAWAVSGGGVKSMKDDDAELISAEAIDKASDVIAADFEKIIAY